MVSRLKGLSSVRFSVVLRAPFTIKILRSLTFCSLQRKRHLTKHQWPGVPKTTAENAIQIVVMLVQLSPWEKIPTSVPVSVKRRRKRSDSVSSDSPEERPLDFTASFVSLTKRYRQSKKRKDGLNPDDETVPSIAITSAHRVSVVGRILSSKLQDSDMQEFSQWQFMSRPGRTSSFFQEAQVNGSKSPLQIAAIMDGRNDKVYALQKENATLCCWKADDASGPDDNNAPATKVALSSPAISLSTLPFNKGVVYGTCQDGSLFVGRWVSNADGKETMNVEYANQVQPEDSQHLSTVMQLNTGAGNAHAGEKRKASNDGDAILYQVFCKANEVLVYRREVNLAEDECFGESSLQKSSVDIMPPLQGKREFCLGILSAGVSQIDESTIAIVYAIGNVENGKPKDVKSRRHYCAPISLETGRLLRSPFALANFTRQAGAVTSSVLAVGTLDEVLLYDIMHGAVIHRAFVTDLVGDCKNWALITEARKSRLAILSEQDGHAHVCFAKATLDGSSQEESKQESGYSLAVGLRSSLASQVDKSRVGARRSVNGLLSSENIKGSERRLQDCVDEALNRLRTCIEEIQDPENLDVQPYHFLNEYEISIVSILAASPTPLLSGKKNSHMLNGSHHAESTSPKGGHMEMNGGSSPSPMNGRKMPDLVRGYTPSCIPQRFIDGATSIVLSALQLPQVESKAVGIRIKLARLDARLILSRLIRTGRLSARRHFDLNGSREYGRARDEENADDCFFIVMRSLKLTNKKGRRVFSPVDLMHDMLTSCPDVSERQMVSMIHYMLCRALPEDIAENFLDPGNLDSSHPYKLLAKRFFQLCSTVRKQQLATKVSEDDVSQLQKQKDALSSKLLRAGTFILVRRMIQYSRCNETLLRKAWLEGLPAKHEPLILSRILADLLKEEGSDAAQSQRRSASYTESITKWIYTLCETCHDRLIASEDDADEPEGESPLSCLLDSVRATLDRTEAAMSLHDVLHRFGTSKSEEDEKESLDAATFVNKPSRDKDSGPVPPYSIERLAF
jgi:hypothetical protein